MVFSRLLEWEEEDQIAIAELEMFWGQYDSEPLYFSLSPKGRAYTDPHSYSDPHTHFLRHDDRSSQGVNFGVRVKGIDRRVGRTDSLPTRQTCLLRQTGSLAEKSITIHHLLWEQVVINKFRVRTGFSESKKDLHFGFFLTAAVTKNNQAELWLIVQQPTLSIFH